MVPLGYPELKAAAVLLQATWARSASPPPSPNWSRGLDRSPRTQPDYALSTNSYGYGDVDPSTFFTRDSINPETNVQLYKNDEYAPCPGRGRLPWTRRLARRSTRRFCRS